MSRRPWANFPWQQACACVATSQNLSPCCQERIRTLCVVSNGNKKDEEKLVTKLFRHSSIQNPAARSA